MSAFIDMTCGKCKRRYGWFGNLMDANPCPHCGWKPDKKELAKDEALMKEMEEKILNKKKES
jgi:hypothetical protein